MEVISLFLFAPHVAISSTGITWLKGLRMNKENFVTPAALFFSPSVSSIYS